MPKSKPGYYAVKVGHKPGIYLSWDECYAQIKGFSQSKSRKFFSKEEAEKYLKSEETRREISEDHRMNKLRVWIDGSTFGNGSKNPRSGIGVFWGDNDPRNLSERIPGIQTNNRAHIYAVIRALEVCQEGEKMLEIMTDSMYLINTYESWFDKWKKNGWVTAGKEPAKNKDLIVRMNELIEARSGPVQMVFVGNRKRDHAYKQADRLAKLGSLK